jgi:hypothetical protein
MALAGLQLNLSGPTTKGASATTKVAPKPAPSNYAAQLAVSNRDTAYGGGSLPIPRAGAVLGASTNAVPSGGGTSYIPAAAPAPISVSGGGGGGNPGVAQPDYGSINDLYAPQMDYLNSLEGQINSSKASQLGDVESQYGAQTAKLQPEQQDLESALGAQEQQFGHSIHSAYDDAYRAYSALQQQANARFGRGSSAYGAVSDLSNQELQRQVGNIGQQDTQGQLSFAQEHTKVKNYIAGKLSDLDQWKRDAIAKVNDNFTNLISQINANRVATEQQKTRDKMALLQNTIAQSQSIAQADQQFKQQLGLFAVQQIANVTGKQFTPQEIKAQIADIMGQLNIGPTKAAANQGLAGAGGLGGFLGANQDQTQGLTQ